jgi:hypothetical protein
MIENATRQHQAVNFRLILENLLFGVYVLALRSPEKFYTARGQRKRKHSCKEENFWPGEVAIEN